MSANTGRAGNGSREARRRTSGVPATALARPGRKTAVGLAGFGSAAALAGAGMAMLASPGSVPPAGGPAHTAQPGVQKATLTASVPPPTLPGSNGTNAADVAAPTPPPGALLTPGSQRNNPTLGAEGTVTLPFSPNPGDLFGTPTASGTAKLDLPSELFGLPSGGSGSATVTSGQAGSFLNSLFGNITIPQQQDLGSFVQSMRLPDGTLPFGESGLADSLASGLAAQQQQDAAAAFNALFGPGGSAAYAQNITEALLPQPMVPFLDPSGVPGFLNTTSTPTGSSAPATGGAALGTGPGAAGPDPATLGPGAGLSLNPIGVQIPPADRTAALLDTPLQGDANVSQSLSGLPQFAQLVPAPNSTALIPDQTVLPGGYIPSGMGIQVIGPGGEIVTVNSAGAQVAVPAGVGPSGPEPATTFPLPVGITLESGVIQVPGNQGTPTLLPGDYKLGNPPAGADQPDNRPTLTILPQAQPASPPGDGTNNTTRSGSADDAGSALVQSAATSNQAAPATDGSAATAPPAPAPAVPAAPAASANSTDDGTGNGGVVTTVPASSQVNGPDLSSMPAAQVTLPAPANSSLMYSSDASGGYGY